MGNRKNLHNKNAVRVIRSNNSDITGYDKMFMFKMDATSNISGSAAIINIDFLFGNNSGTVETTQFNYEVRANGVKVAFDHTSNPIDSIFADFGIPPQAITGINTGDLPSGIAIGDEVEIYIRGQFGTLYFFDGGQMPIFGSLTNVSGNNITGLNIAQWGNMNTINDWERFCKAHDSANIVISATDEPVFAQGVNLNRAFEDTTNNIFTAEALEAVNSWDSNKFGNGGRVFENGSDQPNFNMWSQNGGAAPYGYYMRNNMSGLTNGGANMVPTNIAGWAGYADVSFSDSFQGATGIHNWEKINASQVVDMQYFGWKNTRAKSLGTMEDLSTGKCENFTAMFGYAGDDSFGAEGELLIDPSNWDMSSAKTVFYMFGIETPSTSSWAGELNWKTMRNVIDLHSVVKNRNNYTGVRLNEFAPYSGNVVLFRSAFAKTAINYDFSNWNFSGVDATRTDVQLNENNSSGIMGGFVRDCENMSPENTVKLLEALDRPFGQGGLPVSGVDAQIGTASQEIQFGTTYQSRFDSDSTDWDVYTSRANAAIESLNNKGYSITGLDFWV